jgi:hypothetical protein
MTSAVQGEPMKAISFNSLALKTAIVHTVTYFLVGLASYTLFDYSARFADPIAANFMRPTDHPLIAAGPLFQVLRGFLFGIVFYVLGDSIFLKRNGWLVLWLMLVIVGILSPFGAAPSSIEGVLYTILPLWFHIMGLPEVIIQAGLLAFLTHYWVNHPEARWLNWVFGVLFLMVVLFSSLGILAALGMLPAPS